jgi:glycosyltransferase involved in cell wall biosynthesis
MDMENPLVSIIVPIYNAESYLDSCLASIMNQSYFNIQVILVDDGSTDGSPYICDKYAEKDNRILVIHKKNNGVSSARNTALNACTGTYVMFVDSDDWLDSDTVFTLIEIQKAKDYDIVIFGSYEENTRLNEVTKVCSGNGSYRSKEELVLPIARLIREGSLNQLWNKMYKASVLKNNSFHFDEWLNLGEDALFNYHVFFEIESLYILDQCFYHYIIRDTESLTKRHNPLKYEMLIYINDCLQEKIKGSIAYSCIKPSANHIRFKNVYSCILDLFNKNCPLTYKDKRAYIRRILDKESNSHYHLDNKWYRILFCIVYSKNITLTYCTAFLVHLFRKIKNARLLNNLPKRRNVMLIEFKKRLHDFASKTNIGRMVWTFMSKVKHILFHRRRRLPPNMTVTEFINTMNEKNCRYVILRWFDELPDVRPGDDIDILVHDDDTKLLKSMLKHRKDGIPCDVYNISGVHGFHYKGTAYLPSTAALGILERSVKNQLGASVPSKEDYFYSMAFHALYHKGWKSGLPLSNTEPPKCDTPTHDFTKILSTMAIELGLDISINMDSLNILLEGKGWTPTSKMLKKFREKREAEYD